MTNKLRLLTFFTCVSCIFVTTTFAYSTIITVNSFSKIQKLIQKNKKPHHLLLALDDDDTLTMMPCPSEKPTRCQYVGGPSWFSLQAALPANNPDRIWKTFPQLLGIANLLYSSTNMLLADPLIPETLKTADKLGVTTMIVTDRGYRMVEATESEFNHDRILNLIQKGAIETPMHHISFPGFYFPAQWDKKAVRHIAYVHGTLYVAGQNKGEMIKQFLEKTNETHRIQQIIFVDDTLNNVVDVANIYKNDPRVNAICIHFTRLAKIKQAFFKGKYAKQYQAMANKQWYAIRDALHKNLLGSAY